MVTATYSRRTPEQGVLYRAFVQEWPIIRASSRAANDGGGLPDFVELAVDHFLRCGILGHGFVHARCESCEQSIVVAFSCKQRGICNSCDGKRMTGCGQEIPADEEVNKTETSYAILRVQNPSGQSPARQAGSQPCSAIGDERVDA